jgi:hypothetical protein
MSYAILAAGSAPLSRSPCRRFVRKRLCAGEARCGAGSTPRAGAWRDREGRHRPAEQMGFTSSQAPPAEDRERAQDAAENPSGKEKIETTSSARAAVPREAVTLPPPTPRA